jgi:hypothetical protein
LNEDTPIVPFRQSETIVDPLTELAREGARRILAEALKAAADAFVARFAAERLAAGRQRIVRHGFGPERQIQTGIGAVDVQRPKVRNRMAPSDPASKIRFKSNILPKWARRSMSLDALLPVLYLKGEEDQKTIRGTVFPTQGRVTSKKRCLPLWAPMRRTFRQASYRLSVPPEIAVGPSRAICYANARPGNGRCPGVLERAGQGVSRHKAPTVLPSRRCRHRLPCDRCIR